MKFQALTTTFAAVMLVTLSTAAEDCPGCEVITARVVFCRILETGHTANCVQRNPYTLIVAGPRGELTTWRWTIDVEETPVETSPSVQLDQSFFGNMTQLEYIKFYNIYISELDAINFFDFPWLKELTLGNTGVQQLPEDLLARAPRLTRFEATIGNVTSLPENFFAHNPSLFAVYLHKNRLTSLPEGLFQHNPSLSVVFLTKNRLTSLPEGLFQHNPTLQLVDLSFNQLTELPSGIFDTNENLQYVFMSDNKLSRLPPRLFDNNTRLSSVYLGNNSLTCLPEGLFRQNPFLKHVDLSNNSLTFVSSETFTRNQFNSGLWLKGNPLSCDCHFKGNVTQLSQKEWTVHLPPDCESKMNVSCSTGGDAQFSSNRMVTTSL